MARPVKIPVSGRPKINISCCTQVGDEVIDKHRADEIREIVGKDKNDEPYIPDDYPLMSRLNIRHPWFDLERKVKDADLSPKQQEIYLKIFHKRLSDFLEVLEIIGEDSFIRMANAGAFKKVVDTGLDTERVITNLKGPKELLNYLQELNQATKHAHKSVVGTRIKRRADLLLLVQSLAEFWHEATGREPGVSYDGMNNMPTGPFFRFVKACIPYYSLKNSSSITDYSIMEVIRKL